MTRRAVLLCCAALLAMLAGSPQRPARAAESDDVLEHRVKAVFLYKFAGYVDWPPASFAGVDTPITIAVIGAEPLAAELTQVVAGRTINNRNLTVRRFKAGESLAGVHILFVGSDESSRMGQFARSAKPHAVLTVSESEGALEQGSMINFVMADRRVRFEVALDSAEKSGLRLSSRLLAVAQQVRTGNP
jgi:YfiR/HmsC-like